MDLGAYAQIDNLDQIMKDNGIEVPRLRGLRLMKDEKPVSKEEMLEIAKDVGLYRCAGLCQSLPPFNWNSNWSEMSDRTDAICEYYLELPRYENGGFNHLNPIGIRWDRVHGKKRKAFKYVLKQAKKEVFRQFDLWNKYAGRDDVLYIHARLGSGNWGGYDCDKIVKGQPWYLDHCEDYFDCTYVDIYAKIKERMMIKPITIDGFTEKCPKCGEIVTYAVGTGTIFHGASESYEDWRIIKHDYCPRCGEKMERR